VAYATTQDLENAAGGAERLRQLADWDADGIADSTVLDDFVGKASRWVDGFARAHHSVPFTAPVPTEIVDLVAAEVVYMLRKARQGRVEDEDREDHVERLEWLKMLARGQVRIVLEAEKPAQAAGAETGELASSTGTYDSDDYGGLW
jgi:phage gp36-like protein